MSPRPLPAAASVTRRVRRPLTRGALAATAVVLTSCMLANPSLAVEEPGAEAPPAAAFSGYSSAASASPLKIEIYEPTIPIPSEPQAEVMLAYTRADTSSGSGKSRATWLWPGDAIGEGLKTFVEQLGLPAILGAAGYPIQTNAEFPGGPEFEALEPVPGVLTMRSSADGDLVAGRVGFTTDGDVDKADAPVASGSDEGRSGGRAGAKAGKDAAPADRAAGSGGLLGGLLPGLGGSRSGAGGGPLGDLLGPVTSLLGGGGSRADTNAIPALPGLVEVDGLTSISRTTTGDDQIGTTARASLGDVSLLGGIVQLEGVSVVSRTVADGQEGKGSGRATVGALRIAGIEFGLDDKGPIVPGGNPGIPGLPDDPLEALNALGISLKMPKSTRTVDGTTAEVVTRGMELTIDLAILRPVLSQLPLQDLLDPIPFPEEAAILKSLLGAIPNLAPKVVVTLGTARSKTATVQGIELPSIGDPDDLDPGSVNGGDTGTDPGTDPGAGGDLGDTGSGDLGGALGEGSAPGDAGGSGDAGTGELTDAAPMGSGLPPLNSIPGALMFGGLAAAGVLGLWLRRLGIAALGGAGSCSHGLDTGLPDLRKA
ncbi:choice-of-anchor P family protein [Nocardioides massiliensis]|uniref:Choice-of-anchor G family protein n=1 Tax=Nocardioides massiliensis TaxID=1325935 RepID=A0ABT9NJQ6_9ACTN|nr:choice-of-anchor P family protein [Nocardioides massiliensis]MDP9820629.1 hypothetical protein [Nocardioides massiliensis]